MIANRITTDSEFPSRRGHYSLPRQTHEINVARAVSLRTQTEQFALQVKQEALIDSRIRVVQRCRYKSESLVKLNRALEDADRLQHDYLKAKPPSLTDRPLQNFSTQTDAANFG